MPEIPTKELEVWKANRLVDGRAKLTIQALRVFALGVAKLRPGDLSSRIVTFSVREFAELIECREDDGTLYRDLKQVCKELINTNVEIPHYDRGGKDGGWLVANLVASAELVRGAGIVELEFSQKLAPFLFDFHNRFCRYELQVVMRLSSKHAFRLYELAKSWENLKDDQGEHKSWQLNLEQLRPMLGIGADEYLKYSHFRARVLEPARSQINKHTDIRLSYKEIKKERRVVAIAFRLQPHQTPPTTPAAPESADRVEPSQARSEIARMKAAVEAVVPRRSQPPAQPPAPVSQPDLFTPSAPAPALTPEAPAPEAPAPPDLAPALTPETPTPEVPAQTQAAAPRTGAWTSEEFAQMVAMGTAGAHAKEIAAALGRSPKAIERARDRDRRRTAATTP